MTWVRLNVGGEKMETSLNTMTKYPDSQLAKMFLSDQENINTEAMETTENPACSAEGLVREDLSSVVYNIDCDPKSFKLILSWLRYISILIATIILNVAVVQVRSCATGLE